VLIRSSTRIKKDYCFHDESSSVLQSAQEFFAMSDFKKICGLLLLTTIRLSALAAGGPEENFEISVSRSGAKVETMLPVSELKGTFILVPRGAIKKRTNFSISSKYDECPKLPKNLFDVSPPVNLGPEGEKFLGKLTVRLAIPKNYSARLSKKSAKTVRRDRFEIWKFGPKRTWNRVPATHLARDYVEFSPSVFDGQCYTVTNKL
jgi:hypothetical protein